MPVYVSSPLIESLRKEEQRLRAELEQLQLYRRFLKIRDLINEYQVDGGNPASSQHLVPTVQYSAQLRASPEASIKKTASSEVIRIACEYLERIGRRAQTPEIVQEIERQGVVINNSRKVGVVASYLSNSALFDNKRPDGYGLVSWEHHGQQNAHEPQPARQEIGDVEAASKLQSTSPNQSGPVEPVAGGGT